MAEPRRVAAAGDLSGTIPVEAAVAGLRAASPEVAVVEGLRPREAY